MHERARSLGKGLAPVQLLYGGQYCNSTVGDWESPSPENSKDFLSTTSLTPCEQAQQQVP